MMDYRHIDKWSVWGFPEDPDWDGESYQIGYMTENGTGATVADNLDHEDARLIIVMIKLLRDTLRENKELWDLVERLSAASNQRLN